MLTSFILSAALAAFSSDPSSSSPLVVHEWGTFTSVQGSDGVALEGLQHEEESLPDFVYSRSKVRACPLRDRGYKGLEVDVAHVTKKMETPVIYFYSPTSQRVRLRVCFEKGLLSQWFPVSDLLGPPEGDRHGGPLDMSKVERSFLEWEFDVLPPGAGADALPAVEPGSPWSWQRLPASNLVRTLPRASPRSGPVETEKFLFYRGLGSFDLPVRARTEPGSRIVLSNEGKFDVPAFFVLHVADGHGEFSCVDGIGAGKKIEVARPVSADSPSVQRMVDALIPALVAKLVARGLYADEAEAMARTWERSYFHTEGLRVLYILPEEATEAILPLSISPRPSSIVRVLIGRLECITPESEAAVRQALLDRTSPDAGIRASADERLARLGRFLEPHLRRAIAGSADPVTVASARELLAGL